MSTTSDVKTYSNFINGEWVAAASGQTCENRNPADTRELIGIFQRSGAAEVNLAVEAAHAAFATWSKVPAPRRAEILMKAAALLEQRKEAFAHDMTREMGKVLKETRGDIQEAIDCGNFFAGEGRRMYGVTTPSELPNKFTMATRNPVGVVAMICPWNFPMAIPSWKIFPALVAGNTCVIKPAEYTPLSVYNFVSVLTEAGVPAGVVNIVTGHGSEVGSPLMAHPLVRAVSFTGSSEVGCIIGENCARSFKRCSLELGGKNPMIVLDDANLELALEGALWGAFGTTGQRCTATSRIILQKGIYKKFIDELVMRSKLLRLGNGLDPKVDVGPVVSKSQMETILGYIELGKGEGSRLVTGGNPFDRADYKHGFFIEPTVFGDVEPQMRVAQEEIFGPVVSCIPCDSLEDGIQIANNVKYGLSSSLYTKDVNRAFAAIRDLDAGITYINAPTIGAEVHLPFGGVKQTGNGHREGGVGALDFYTEWKAVYVDYSDKLQKAQIDRPE
ncbi:MAG: aldehyde dehydrogenase family protein [Acidobacteriota bacterium]|nr:aldehyde dehydrogenase family protein [Acidobacteriota bacterium]